MFAKNSTSTNYSWLTFVVALVLPLFFYLFAPNLFMVKTDDIPWAQGVDGVQTSNSLISRSLLDIGIALAVFMAVQLILLLVGKFVGINGKWITLITIISLLLGIALEFSSVGNSIVWGIMFRFRLEKYDAYANLYLNLLSAGFILVFSVAFGCITEFAFSKFHVKMT